MGQEMMSSRVVPEAPRGPVSGIDSLPPKRRFALGMNAKTTLAMVVVGLVPLVIFGLVTLMQQNARLRSDAELSMQRSAETVSAQVDEWIDKNFRVLQAGATLGAMSSMNREEQAKILSSIRQACPWMFLVFTVNRDGKNIARSDAQPLTDYSDRKYVADIISGGKETSWDTLIGKTSGKPTLVLAVPIKVNGVSIGVLAASMVIEEISRIVATWKSGTTGFAFLVDEASRVVAHPQPQFALTQRRLSDHPLISAYTKDGLPHVLRFLDGNTEMLGAVHGNHMRWAVTVQQSAAELFTPLQQTLRLGVGLLFAAAVLVGIFALVLSRMLVRPIVDMTRAADQMSMGQLNVAITAPSEDELGLLAAALERLRKSMLIAMERLTSR